MGNRNRSAWFRLVSSSVVATSLSAVALAQGSSSPTETSQATDPAAPPAEKKGLLPLPNFGGDLWERAYLTGDWNDARNALSRDAGIQLDLSLVQFVQGTAHGGVENTGPEYGGTFDTHLQFDLMRMGIMPGALLDVRALSRYGDFISTGSGQLLPVNTNAIVPNTSPAYGDYGIAVTNLTYVQFFSEKFAALVGKIDTFNGDQNEFATGRGATQFMNFNLVFAATTGIVPASTLGTGVLLLPNEWLTISSTLLNAQDTTSTVGFDDIHGGISSTEVQTQYRLGDLPGGANGSFLYFFHSDFVDLGSRASFEPGQGLSIPSKDHSWMTVLSGWQYLHTEDDSGDRPLDLGNGKPDLEGWGLFSRVAFADEDTNPWKFTASGGIGGRGLIPTRDNDVLGVGYYYNDVDPDRFLFSNRLDDSGQGMECFYNIAITPAVRLTFDFQWIDSVVSSVDDGYVLGARLQTSF